MTLSKLQRLAAKFEVAAEKTSPSVNESPTYWNDDYDGVKTMLKSLGLRYSIAGFYTKVIKVDKLNVILKRRSGLSCNPPTKEVDSWLLEHIIPTVSFRLPDSSYWVVQPVALRDPARKARALRHFMELRYKDLQVDDLDIHGGNVGWYNNKPVLIDW